MDPFHWMASTFQVSENGFLVTEATHEYVQAVVPGCRIGFDPHAVHGLAITLRIAVDQGLHRKFPDDRLNVTAKVATQAIHREHAGDVAVKAGKETFPPLFVCLCWEGQDT